MPTDQPRSTLSSTLRAVHSSSKSNGYVPPRVSARPRPPRSSSEPRQRPLASQSSLVRPQTQSLGQGAGQSLNRAAQRPVRPLRKPISLSRTTSVLPGTSQKDPAPLRESVSRRQPLRTPDGSKRWSPDPKPMVKIDCETQIPRDLFDRFLACGRAAQERGQHVLENSPTSGPRLVQMLTPGTPRVTPAADAGQAVDKLLEESEQQEKPRISKIKSRVKVADKENVPQSARPHKAEARELRPCPCHVEALCPRRPAPNSAKQKLCGHEKDGLVEKQEFTDEERSSVEELYKSPTVGSQRLHNSGHLASTWPDRK